jgi:hypothetical protein
MIMPFLPKRGRTVAHVIATFQAFALAVFLMESDAHGSWPSAAKMPSRDNSLVASTDDLETRSISQDADDLDGQQQDEGGLIIMIFAGVHLGYGFPLKPGQNHFPHLSTIPGYSLIRSPPIS